MLGFVFGAKLLSAQPVLFEGIVEYDVYMTTPEKESLKGTYLFLFKNDEIRKELDLSNGYRNTRLINCREDKIFSLQTMNGRNYAIQYDINMQFRRVLPYQGFCVDSEAVTGNAVAGCAEYVGKLRYKDGSTATITYTKDWMPPKGLVYTQFPDAPFLPLSYTYTRSNGVTVFLKAKKIQAGPVATSMFRIPANYKMVSLDEYKQLSR